MAKENDDDWWTMPVHEVYWLVNAFLVISGMIFVIGSVKKGKNMNFVDFLLNKIVRLFPR